MQSSFLLTSSFVSSGSTSGAHLAEYTKNSRSILMHLLSYFFICFMYAAYGAASYIPIHYA